jgi:spermidine/putrescine transport system permease protein
MTRLREIFLAPGALIIVALFLAPLCIIIDYSFLSRGAYGGVSEPLTTENYRRLFDPIYAEIIWRSFWIAGTATLLCLILGFPMALFIAQSKYRTLMLNLIMLPFWTSFLVRTYAWMFLLRDTGLFNSLLLRLHLIQSPLPLLFNNGAVVLGLVYGYLPFMILPLYATIEKMDPALLDAAADLGANPVTTIWKVVVPLNRGGIVAGSLLVFIPCLGAYLTPDLLGGGRTVMIGNLVQNQFTSARDWPFGSAASLLMMGIVLLLLFGVIKKRGEELI